MSSFLCQSVKKCEIKPSLKTDHSILLQNQREIYVSSGQKVFGNLENELLHDKKYVETVKRAIEEFEETNGDTTDKGLHWDSLKCHIRGVTLKHSFERAKLNREREKKLNKKLEALMEQIAENRGRED